MTAIGLTVLRQAETYIFSLDLPSQSSDAPQASAPASWSVGGMTPLSADIRGQLNETINAAVERLRRAYVGSRRKREASDSLLRLGQFLFNVLLPPALQDALRDLPEQNIPIILTTNDTELPWELLHDGTEYLTLKHPIARRLWSAAPVRPKPMPESSSRSFLLITNPTEDLAEADKESDDLMDLFERELISGASLKVLARHRANWLRVSQALGGNYDIIHYSGHAERGVLLLRDGELTTEDIERTLQGHPFVFLNACWSSREAKQVKSADALDYAGVTIRNMAQAFILGGSAGFIGTLWPVFDQSSRQFAEYFYTHVLDGVPVGEALRRTREQMKEEQPDDPIWASFVHYGNPMLTLAKAPPETRHVTVLVARIEGLLPLFEKVGLEEASEIRQQAIGQLRLIAERYAGQFHAPLSDLLNVHFGAPIAHGADADHAIYAALDMIRTLRTLGTRLSVPLTLRIGISTEQVLIRWQTTNQEDYQIDGQVEGVAAALATHAGICEIWLDQNTYQLARDKFTVERSELLTMTLGTAPRVIYRVVEPKSDRTTVRVTVGRDEKLAQLRRWLRETTTGQGRVVGIVGAAGVGKTSLVESFRDEMEGVSHRWISAYCYSYAQTESYALLAQVIRELAGFNSHDNEATQRRKLAQLVLETIPGQPTEALLNEGQALLGRVVGLSFPAATLDNLDPKLQQKKLVRVFEAVLRSQAASQAIVLLLEDLQWADQASLSVLNQIVKSVRRMPLLLLAVYRPEWSHNWGNDIHYRNLPLDDLSEDAQRTLLAHLLGMAVPPEKLAQAILKQTGGNPFFIKEYVWLLQENGFLVRSGHLWLQARDIAEIPLLNRVERLIQARLDRLPDSSRKVIQSAAVIGEKFEDELLVAVPKKVAREQLNQDLHELTKQSLIYEAGGWPLLFYTFSHGLIHEIIYRLLREPFRRTLHRLVAQALSRLYDDQEQILYRLARHYYYSNERLNAISYCLRAAKSDAQKWANQGALLWYARALEKIESFEEEPASEKEQKEGATVAQILAWHVEALEGQADVLSTMGQTGSSIPSYTRALELGAEREPVARLANLYHKLAVQQQSEGQFDLAQDALNQGLELLDGQESIEASIEAGKIHVYTGLIGYRRGRFAQALADCQKGIAILDKTESIRDLAQGYNLQGMLYRRLGESQKGIEAYDQSVALYEQADYLPGLERASYNRACLYRDLGKWQEALASFEESSSLSHRTGEERRQAAALNAQGAICLRQGKLEQAINASSQAAQLFEALGSEQFLATALMNLGVSHLKKGAIALARNNLEKSFAIYQRLKADQHLPKALYYLAQLELLSEQPTNALHLAQEALKFASQQGNRQQEGEIKRTLGQAYRELGQQDLANQQLEESLTILEERNIPHEVGLTLVELAGLRKAQADSEEDSGTRREQAIAYCEQAIPIFEKLAAALDLKQAQEIRQSLALGGISKN